MPFDMLVSSVIETSLNQAIGLDDYNQTHLTRLRGKVIRVQLTNQPFSSTLKQWFFVFNSLQSEKITQYVDVLTHYDDEVDCDLQLDANGLKEMRDPDNLPELIKQERLIVKGELALAQQFSILLTEITPDPAELLSKLTGDVVAHSLVEGTKNQWQKITAEFERQAKHASTVVTEEWKLAPSALEIANFCDDAYQLNKDFLDLESRFNAVFSKLASHE